MKNRARRVLSLLLALAMVLSYADLGFAQSRGEAPAEALSEAATEDGEELKMEELDPSSLGVSKLGEEESEEDEEGPISLKPDTSLEQTVRVSIFLEGKSTVDAGFDTEGIAGNKRAAAYRDGLKASQQQMTAKIESVLGRRLDVKWNLTLLTNAISADVKIREIPFIERLAGVRSVEREMHYEAPVTEAAAKPQTANTSENMVGAAKAWYELGYTGAGSKVAIIDTGLDTNHQSMNAEAFDHAIEEVRAGGKTVELMTSIPSSGLNAANPVRVSDKIPFAYNYVDRNTRVDHRDDASNHGSHVAGIAAANRYIKSGSGYVDAASSVKAVGMAPDAQILVMKVFGTNGGAYDSDYFAAIEDAVVLGADAANLSLGSSSPGFSYAGGSYQAILNGLVSNRTNNHMVLSISAGNAGSFDQQTPHKLYAEDAYYHTGGSPGSFIHSLSTAAAQNTLTEGTPLIFNGTQQVFYTEDRENNDGQAYSHAKMTSIAGTWDYVYIDAPGEASDYSAVDRALSLSGKVVIVNRGGLAFAEKGNNVKAYAPKALIIANNTDGVIHMDLSDFTGSFPFVSLTQKDAEAIKTGSTEHTADGITYYTGSVLVTTAKASAVLPREEAEITDFSSWGVPGSLIMKPEITAPGGDIYSLNGTSSAASDSGTGTASYVSYSGTSMAAPHITGLAAVLMQYLKEKTPANASLTGAYDLRAMANSLLMSTATPMISRDAYLSVLQQGAGLAEVSRAIEASSVLMMDEAGLTTATGAAADGKVKAELGDDSEKKGEYVFSFTVYNISDETLSFELATELFTQEVSGDTLSHRTALLPEGGVTYEWNGSAPAGTSHDVDRDGDTDADDAQAILDHLTGRVTADGLDLSAADLDGDETVTSRDAYLLLKEEPAAPAGGYSVAPHGEAHVTVRIRLTAAQRSALEKDGGAYLEGFTYVSCVTSTGEGLSLEHEHSIPILGYYGSWTDASMFDTNSYTEKLYGNDQLNYSGHAAEDTNYMRITANGTRTKFSGNPYMVEETFPEDRLALRSDALINSISYNLIRSAGGTGFAAAKLDEEGKVCSILTSNVTAQETDGLWYSEGLRAWQNTAVKSCALDLEPNALGLKEGDRVRVGFYAIPEYNAMMSGGDMTAADAGSLTDDRFRTILMSGKLGRGAFVGFDLTIDDTAPELWAVSLSGDELSVTADDDRALAYVAVLSLDGTVKYAEAAPGTDSCSLSFDISDAIADAQGYVAVFAGDYAGNETAAAVKVNDNTRVQKDVYVLTDTLEAGREYLIADSAAAGTGHALAYTAPTRVSQASAAVSVYTPEIKPGIDATGNRPYIELKDAAAAGIWTASDGITLSNVNGTKTWYLGYRGGYSTPVLTNPAEKNWQYSGGLLKSASSNRYLSYSDGSFGVGTAQRQVFLYVKTQISYEEDPDRIMSVTVTPASLDLYKGGQAALTAEIAPLTASPRTLIWTSSNEGVATVDENGIVTAEAKGTAIIRAAAAADSTKYGECTVTVEAITKELSAAIWDEEGDVYFSYFSTDSLPAWTKRHSTPADKAVSSAFMQTASSLYAATNDMDVSRIYTVSRSSYALSELGENYVPAFGMAPVGSSFGSGYFVYAFARYLIFGNLEPEDDGDGGMFSGLPYGLLDLSATSVGDAYAVAVCAKSRGTSSSDYYFLDENGRIWQTRQSYSSYSGISFGTPSLVYDTGISAGLSFNSIYYDGTNLYWSRQDGDHARLYILAGPGTSGGGKFYEAGNFGAGVWPAAGLYADGAVAPAAAGDEPAEDGGRIDLSAFKAVTSRDELMTAEIRARLDQEAVRLAESKPGAPKEDQAKKEEAEVPETAEEASETETETLPVVTEMPENTEPAGEEASGTAEEAAENTEAAETLTEEASDETTVPAEEATAADPGPEGTEAEVPAESDDAAFTGSLNMVYVRPAAAFGTALPNGAFAEEPEEGPDTVTVTLAEAVPANNGLYTVSYRPELMTVKAVESSLGYYSFCDDREAGSVIFAFAASEAVGAGEAAARITFTVNACEEVTDGIEAITRQRNEELALTESEFFTVPGIGHDWGDPVWSWIGNDRDGYTEAKAVFSCRREESHKTELTDESLDYAVTLAPEVDAEGEAQYTAVVVLNGKTYTAVKTIVLDKLPASGYHITVTEDHTDGGAVTDLEADRLYSGTVSFTFSAPGDRACLIAVKHPDGGYSALAAAGDGVHRFTLEITADTELAVLYKGDVNLDGEVTSRDAHIVSKYSVETAELTALQQLAADVNGSGDITSRDANLISKVVVETGHIEW